MIGFNRFESLKKGIADGKVDFVMMLADFHFVKGTITQAEYDELVGMAYPVIEVVEEVIEEEAQ